MLQNKVQLGGIFESKSYHQSVKDYHKVHLNDIL